MPSTNLVPCFYTGQDYRREAPAESYTRDEVRKFKARGLGKFRDSGKVFLFSKSIASMTPKLWDGPLGIGNLLPFAKPHNQGDKLHYATPMAGDRTSFARHRRHIIRVSGRSQFAVRASA